jgi:hypothetical protein
MPAPLILPGAPGNCLRSHVAGSLPKKVESPDAGVRLNNFYLRKYIYVKLDLKVK